MQEKNNYLQFSLMFDIIRRGDKLKFVKIYKSTIDYL